MCCFLIYAFIRNVIKTCIYIAIDVVVFFICSLSDYIESLEWPVVDTFYGLFKVVAKFLFEVDAAYTPVPHFLGQHDVNVVARGNDYVEDLLRDINDKLLEKSFTFKDKVAGVQNTKIIPVTGEIRLCSNMHMDYRLMRAGNCFLRGESIRTAIGANLKCCELYFESDIEIKVGHLTKTFHVTGNIPYMEAYVEFFFNNETSYGGELLEFIIVEMFGTNLKFFGAGPLNTIVNFTGKKLFKVLKRRVITILQEIMRSQLVILIRTYKFPATKPSLTLECSPRSERLQAISEESDLSESQSANSDSSECSPPREKQTAIAEAVDHSASREQQTAIAEAVDHSTPREQQTAIAEAVDHSTPREQQTAIAEAVDHSSPGEQQGQGLGETSSSYPEQQIQNTVANGSTFIGQDSSTQCPRTVPLISIEDYSQCSDKATVETDCSLDTCKTSDS